MSKIIYYCCCVMGALSMLACNNIHDEENNLLHNTNANTGGLTGPRFLYQEVDGGVVRRTYGYDQLKMVSVTTPTFVETLSYSGDNVYKIEHQDNSGAAKVSYTRFINYVPNSSTINNINEDLAIITKDPNSTPKNPKPDIVTKFKSLYTFTLNGNTITGILKKTAKEIPGAPLNFDQYAKIDLAYAGGNIQTMMYTSGAISGGTLATPDYKLQASYSLYDDKKSPRASLLPMVYNLSTVLDTPAEAYRLSVNNPGRKAVNDFTNPVQTESSLFTYDPQGYLKTGYGRMYDYRPF